MAHWTSCINSMRRAGSRRRLPTLALLLPSQQRCTHRSVPERPPVAGRIPCISYEGCCGAPSRGCQQPAPVLKTYRLSGASYGAGICSSQGALCNSVYMAVLHVSPLYSLTGGDNITGAGRVGCRLETDTGFSLATDIPTAVGGNNRSDTLSTLPLSWEPGASGA
jgi:hypothetical protein